MDAQPRLSSVGVSLSLTVDQSDVNKSSGVQQSLVSSSLRLLWLFSLVDLWSLRLNLTGTSQGSVDFTLLVLVTDFDENGSSSRWEKGKKVKDGERRLRTNQTFD